MRLSLLALLALAACGDGNPLFDEDGGAPPAPPGPTDPAIPEAVAGNLGAATFVPPSAGNPDGSLRVRITALDAPDVTAGYARAAGLDVPGYTAYAIQDDPLDRLFVGMGAESGDGALEGVLVVGGGQFNTYFGGVDYGRTGPYSGASGLVSYAGTYVGMLNVNVSLPVPPGTDPAVVPGQPLRVTGDVFLNADFADNSVNGAIFNREIADGGVSLTLVDIVLVPTDIDATGRFAGAVERFGEPGSVIGSHAGVFGGTGATSVAGGVRLDGDFIDEVDDEEEYGLFVLDQCGQAGTPAICGIVDVP